MTHTQYIINLMTFLLHNLPHVLHSKIALVLDTLSIQNYHISKRVSLYSQSRIRILQFNNNSIKCSKVREIVYLIDTKKQ